MKLSFSIPGPPVAKGRPRLGAGGHTYTPEKTKRYERHAATCAFAAVRNHGRWRLDWGSYALTLRIYREKATFDIDNAAKSLLDGFNGVIYQDDAAVRDLRVVMDEDPSRPRAEVEVELLGDETLEQRRKRISAQRRREANG